MADNTSDTLDFLRKQRAARRSSSVARSPPASDASSSFAMVREPAPTTMLSSAVGSVLIGGGSGEEASTPASVLSVLTDSRSPFMDPLASSTSKGSAASALASKTSTFFRLFFVTETDFLANMFCGGIVASTTFRNGCICARPSKECTIKSHHKKSPDFGANTVYLQMYRIDDSSGSPTSTTERVIEHKICKIKLDQDDMENDRIQESIEVHNIKMSKIVNGSKDEAIVIFNNFAKEVATILEDLEMIFDAEMLTSTKSAVNTAKPAIDDRDPFMSSGWDDFGLVKEETTRSKNDGDDGFVQQEDKKLMLEKVKDEDTADVIKIFSELGEQVFNQGKDLMHLQRTVVEMEEKNAALQLEIDALKKTKAGTQVVSTIVRDVSFRKYLSSNTSRVVATSTRELEQRIAELEIEHLDGFGTPTQDVEELRTGLKTFESKLNAVMRKLKSLPATAPGHQAAGSLPDVSSGTTAGAFVGPVSTAVPMSTEVLDMMKLDLDGLAAKVALVEAQVGNGDFVQVGDHTFKSALEMQVFVQNHIPSCSYECFVDIVALMDTLKGTTVDDASHASTEHSALKTKYVSARELTISNSFSHYTPLTLCSKSDSSDTVQIASVSSSLAKIKKYSDWKGETSSSGFKRWLTAELNNHKRSIKNDITRTLYNEHGLPTMGASLALDYLQKSCECIGELLNWTETFYSDLQDHSNVPAAEAWDLAMKCWLQFFHELRKVRCECSGMSSANLGLHTDERRHIISQYLWTMGRAIKVQEEFKSFGFEEHPAIATVINYHLLKHSVATHQLDDAVSKFEKKFKDLDEKFASLNSWKSQTARTLANLSKTKPTK